jgi:hypothetical protein
MKTPRPSVFLVGTIHNLPVKTNENLLEAINSSHLVIQEGVHKNKNIFSDLKLDPLLVIISSIYFWILYKVTRNDKNSDAGSIRKLLSKETKIINVDAQLGTLIKIFPKALRIAFNVITFAFLIGGLLLILVTPLGWRFISSVVFLALLYLAIFASQTASYRNDLVILKIQEILHYSPENILVVYGMYHLDDLQKKLANNHINVKVVYRESSWRQLHKKLPTKKL